jgi:hypothetical protein
LQAQKGSTNEPEVERTMREYVVYRVGWNEVNQNPQKGLPAKMPVARILANSPEEAGQTVAPTVGLAANQRLTAELAEVVDAKEENLNVSPRSLPELPEE